MNSQIKVVYRSVDGVKITRKFSTIKGAQKFAHNYVGNHPELGNRYAISSDGVGKVTCEGCMLTELFPNEEEQQPMRAIVDGGLDDEFAEFERAEYLAEQKANQSQSAMWLPNMECPW